MSHSLEHDSETTSHDVSEHASRTALVLGGGGSTGTSGGGFAYRVGDRRFIDGGYRSNAENADLAAEHERVLVLAPLGGRWWTPPEWGTHLAAQVDELRAGGGSVETVFPESSSAHLFGADAMDVSLRPLAARAGYDQGRVLAAPLTRLWR